MDPVELNVPNMREFIYLAAKLHSPVGEAEIEEIARCALRGGYKLDPMAFLEAQVNWMNRPE